MSGGDDGGMSMSLSSDVPLAIQAFLDRTNAGDADGLVATFTEDALVADGGREYRGREEVAAWDRAANIGRRTQFELLGLKPGLGDHQFVVTVVVGGDGDTGTGDLEFTVRGDRIARLVVAP